MDWTQIGTIVGGIISGIGAYFLGRGKRRVAEAAAQATVAEHRADMSINDAATKQIQTLIARVESLETRYSKLWDELQKEKAAGSKLRDRVRQLEGILRANQITVPPEAS